MTPRMQEGVILHWAEIAIKGKNRSKFVTRLMQNITRLCHGLPIDIEHVHGRLWIAITEPNFPKNVVLDRLRYAFGVASFSPATFVPLELDTIKETALKAVRGLDYQTFRVTSRRAFKEQPLSSQQVDREVGAYLMEHQPRRVNLDNPEVQVYVEMIPRGAFIYTQKIAGTGGLPVGSSGKVMALMSGGIDSPVAAHRLQKRGCHVDIVHFHSHPFVSRASQEKALELAQILSRFQSKLSLTLVPFGELQRQIMLAVPPPLRVILYRRFMLRIAGALAKTRGAKALVTGDALGQVASQTLSNLVAIDQAAPLTVLRPLIGFDKQEIISAAHALGTFETSILPDQDCCTLFVPRSPETHASLEEVLAAESVLNIQELVDQTLAGAAEKVLVAEWLQETAPATPKPQINASL